MFKKLLFIFISFFIILKITIPVNAFLPLTEEEREYIEKANIIKAISSDGVAPIQYTNLKGEVQGITKRVLEEISNMTGLIFECKLYDSIEKIYNSDYDILFGIPDTYAPEGIVLSKPFLKTETILYINASLDSNKLENKRYAAIKGAALPKGIKEENVLYYETREASLNAVESGEADYGYGNAYSVSFYTLQNGYKNIMSIPKGIENREYCIGVPIGNDLLLSIFNKSLDAIDDSQMQTLILDVTSKVDRKITLSMVADVYGGIIFRIAFALISILLLSVFYSISVNNKLKMEIKKNEILSQISNEYMYEYHVKLKYLELSEKCMQLFGDNGEFSEAAVRLKHFLLKKKANNKVAMIKLPLVNGQMGVFKTISSRVYDSKGKVHSIVGKLIDISEEIKEKERLIKKSQIDGLTGLYNAITTKELIISSIKNKDKEKLDAFIIIDCDNFKKINDDYGHLAGDKVLKDISKTLKSSFRSTDIVGRIGGDEFCIYMNDIPSEKFVKIKCKELLDLIQKTNKDFYISLSIGISFVTTNDSYEDMFKKADTALYRAKSKGGARVIVYDKKQDI